MIKPLLISIAICLSGAVGIHAQDSSSTAVKPDSATSDTARISKRQALKKKLLAEQQEIIADLKNALAAESTLDAAKLSEHTVAVLPFAWEKVDSQYAPLSAGLADMMITDLTKVKNLTVVERLRLQKLMAELALDQAGVINDSQGKRCARLTGAGTIVGGKLAVDSSGAVSANVGIARSLPDAPGAAKLFTGTVRAVFNMEKEIVFGVIGKMGISLSDEERQAIQIIPTESLLAFLAYSRGLEAMDHGDYTKARAEFAAAIQADPGFSQAADLQEVSEALAEPAVSAEEKIIDQSPADKEIITVSTESGGKLADKEPIIDKSAIGANLAKEVTGTPGSGVSGQFGLKDKSAKQPEMTRGTRERLERSMSIAQRNFMPDVSITDAGVDQDANNTIEPTDSRRDAVAEAQEPVFGSGARIHIVIPEPGQQPVIP